MQQTSPRPRRLIAVAFAVGAMLAACSSSNLQEETQPEETQPEETQPEETQPEETQQEPIPDVAVPIVSTGADEVRDLIRTDDPSTLACVVDLGVGPGEFYDKVTDELVFPDETAFFEARYTDGSVVEIRIHPAIAGDDAAAQANRIAKPVGRLPSVLRANIQRIGFLGGDATAQGDGEGEGIHLYADNVALRQVTNRLEETLFHESVHTSLDDTWANSDLWLEAQAADGAFLTEYAASQPEREDLAETALYAWALLYHPDRISEADAAAWRATIPNRIDAIGAIIPGPDNQPDPQPITC